MSALSDEKLLGYYQRELAYLRKAGSLFAKDHPKIARRLDITPFESADPHTERLIESFAFLTARLHKDIDDKFPRISQSLLSVLYPQLVEPIPSVAIAHFHVEPQGSNLTSVYRVPQRTELRTPDDIDSGSCAFQTCFDLELWPITLHQAEIVSMATLPLPKSVTVNALHGLRLHFRAPSTPFHQLNPKHLRLFITGDPAVAHRIYDMLMTQPAQVFMRAAQAGQKLEVPFTYHHFTKLSPVGLAHNEAMLPYPGAAHPGYRLLQEYAVLPEKFMFIDIGLLDCQAVGADLEILITLSPGSDVQEGLALSNENFLLGCTPIVNLFNRISDPIRLDYQQDEYRLVADVRRERSTEIHSIQRVTSARDDQKQTLDYFPYFSFDHTMHDNQEQAFWFAQRRPTVFSDMLGTDVHLSFVNQDFDPKSPENEIVYAYVSCTNRGLAEKLAPGTHLIIEAAAPVQSIRCLSRPTSQVPATLDVAAQWKLVSHLCLNHLSLQDGDMGLEALKEQLRIYNIFGSRGVTEQLSRLTDLECEPVVRRIGVDTWRGFVRGLGVTMTVLDQSQGQGSMVLFGQVLSQYLSLFASINSFVELTFKRASQEGTWKQWNPVLGEQFLL